MNRWITALAFGTKCGRRGAVVPGTTDGEADAERPAWLSSDARAILPTPTPQSRKKCRRVTAWAISVCQRSIGKLPLLMSGDRFVEIQQHAQRCPRGRFHRLRLVRLAAGERLRREDGGVEFFLVQPLALMGDKGQQVRVCSSADGGRVSTRRNNCTNFSASLVFWLAVSRPSARRIRRTLRR